MSRTLLVGPWYGEFGFEVADRCREGRRRDMARKRGPAEMLLAGEGDQVQIFSGDHHIVDVPIIAESRTYGNTLSGRVKR